MAQTLRHQHRPALDAAHLARQTLGDRELERELLALFEAQCRRLVPVIAGVVQGIARPDAAHTLRGAALAIGAGRVAALCEDVERLFAADGKGDGRALGPLAEDLAAAVRDVTELASAHLASREREPELAKHARLR